MCEIICDRFLTQLPTPSLENYSIYDYRHFVVGSNTPTDATTYTEIYWNHPFMPLWH